VLTLRIRNNLQQQSGMLSRATLLSRVSQNHTCLCIHGVYTVFLVSLKMTTHTVIYGVDIRFWPPLMLSYNNIWNTPQLNSVKLTRGYLPKNAKTQHLSYIPYNRPSQISTAAQMMQNAECLSATDAMDTHHTKDFPTPEPSHTTQRAQLGVFVNMMTLDSRKC